jgi:sulfite reductase beta subunit-like hemoprotein
MAIAGHTIERFDFFVGGGVGRESGIARRVGYRAVADEVADALERLFLTYTRSRATAESFRQWLVRIDDRAVKAILIGDPMAEAGAEY